MRLRVPSYSTVLRVVNVNVNANCINAPIHSHTTRIIPAATPLHC